MDESRLKTALSGPFTSGMTGKMKKVKWRKYKILILVHLLMNHHTGNHVSNDPCADGSVQLEVWTDCNGTYNAKQRKVKVKKGNGEEAITFKVTEVQQAVD